MNLSLTVFILIMACEEVDTAYILQLSSPRLNPREIACARKNERDNTKKKGKEIARKGVARMKASCKEYAAFTSSRAIKYRDFFSNLLNYHSKIVCNVKMKFSLCFLHCF